MLKVMHELFVASECSENIIRILFVDVCKAFDLTNPFDLTDHNTFLLVRFVRHDVPEHVIVWSLHFLNDH